MSDGSSHKYPGIGAEGPSRLLSSPLSVSAPSTSTGRQKTSIPDAPVEGGREEELHQVGPALSSSRSGSPPVVTQHEPAAQPLTIGSQLPSVGRSDPSSPPSERGTVIEVFLTHEQGSERILAVGLDEGTYNSRISRPHVWSGFANSAEMCLDPATVRNRNEKRGIVLMEA